MNQQKEKNIKYKQETRSLRTFNNAINKKGYLSLCSIVESQFFYPRKYPLFLKKNSALVEVDSLRRASKNINRFDIALFREKLRNEHTSSNNVL